VVSDELTGTIVPQPGTGGDAAHYPVDVQGFGVDIGGSGIKGCPVDLEKGQLIGERLRIETPQPSLPGPVYGVVAQIVDHFGWTGRVGVTFPGVMKNGVAHTAANVDKSWIGTNVDAGLSALIPGTVETLNDADAAGIAEMRYGAGRDRAGVILMLTFGTGIGSALFVDGHLVPNTEFGHIQVDGEDGERRASAGVQVGTPAHHADAGRHGPAAERRRHRRGRPGRARAPRPLSRGGGRRSARTGEAGATRGVSNFSARPARPMHHEE
jgi:predicted NBD/HSP70 family sugar kinase